MELLLLKPFLSVCLVRDCIHDVCVPFLSSVPMLTVSVFPIWNAPLRIGTLRDLVCCTIFDIEPPANLLQDLVLSFTWDGPRSSSGDYTISQTPLYFNDHLEHYYIKGYLTIHDIGYQDAGEYTCTVTVSSEGNDIGRPISESTTLAIPGELLKRQKHALYLFCFFAYSSSTS